MSSVAVKNPETPTAGLTERFRAGVLVGVLYIIGSLAILFELLPWLWWDVFGLPRYTASGAVNAGTMAELVLIGIAVAVGLIYGGLRLLGPHPIPGVKAGIFTTLVLLLFVALLTRWASTFFENWVYEGSIGETLGITLTAIVGGFLLFLMVRYVFLGTRFPRRMVALEESGWFTAANYKRNQGRMVRRGTIFGLLFLAGCGIYSLEAHKTLVGASDWAIAIPFTGQAQLKAVNDARILYDRENLRKQETVTMKLTPTEAGDSFLDKISKDFRQDPDADLTVISLPPDSPFALANPPMNLGDTIVEVDGKEVKTLSALRLALEKEQGERDMLPATPREVKLTVHRGSGFPVNQITFRRINRDLKNYVRITSRGSSKFYDGQVVDKDEYEPERRRIAKEPSAKEPGIKAPDPAVATVVYSAAIPILPHVRYSLLLLLAAMSLWFAWRIVNVPSFADFLIATEAELNKVSWTTRRRLFQDTVVVLVTVVLFTVFLFVVDIAWGGILSSEIIKVLRLPPRGQANKIPGQNW